MADDATIITTGLLTGVLLLAAGGLLLWVIVGAARGQRAAREAAAP
ncbi:hypothetical protein [Microbacterium sp. R86528]